MNQREAQKEKRRQEILAAGLELFVTKGYSATKISDIAGKVNMSTGLMFHYFESKEKLYEELVKLGASKHTFPLEQKYEHAIDYFSFFAEQLFTFMKEQPFIAKMFVLMSAAQRNEAVPAYIREMACGMSTIEQFVPLVEWGQREGSIREGNPMALSNSFWAAIQGIAEQYARCPENGLPEAEWIVDIVRKK